MKDFFSGVNLPVNCQEAACLNLVICLSKVGSSDRIMQYSLVSPL
jgi:hypothetical protein